MTTNATQRMIFDLIDAGRSQAEIARAIGLKHWTLSRWADGRAPRTHDALLALVELHRALTTSPREK